MDYTPRNVLRGIDVPQFLDADAVNLRLAVGFEVEDAFDLLGEMTTRALGKKRVFGV